MVKFIIRRLVWMLLVLFLVSVVTFSLMHAVPGGPFDRERPIPKQTLELLNKKFHFKFI